MPPCELSSPVIDARPPAPPHRTGPLSWTEECFWQRFTALQLVEALKDGDDGAVTHVETMQIAKVLDGPLQVGLLEASLNDAIARQEILRTSFAQGTGTPRRVVAASRSTRLQKRSVQHCSEAARDREVLRLIVEDKRRPFDFTHSPLARWTLVRRTPHSHVLVQTISHQIVDYWSMELIAREVSEFYRARLTRTPPALPPLRVSYSDYAAEQRALFDDQQIERRLGHWRRVLAGVPEIFPRRREARPAGPEPRDDLQFRMAPVVMQELQRVSREHRATIYAFLFAALSLLIFRLSRLTPVVIGTPVWNRAGSDLAAVAGYFAEHRPVRTDFRGNPRFLDIVEQVRRGILETEGLPAVVLATKLGDEYAAAMRTFVRFQFNLITPRVTFTLPGVTTSDLPGLGQLVNNDIAFDPLDSYAPALLLQMFITKDDAEGYLRYNSGVASMAATRAFAAQFQTLVADVVRNPTGAVEGFSIAGAPA